MQIENIKKEIKTVEEEIKTVEEEIKEVENTINDKKTSEDIKELLKYKLESLNNSIDGKNKKIEGLNNSIEKIKRHNEILKQIKNKSYDEVLKLIENKEIKLTKKELKQIKKEEIFNKLATHKDVKILKELYTNQSGIKIKRGYMLQYKNKIYCIDFNFIAVEVEEINNCLNFKFNDEHQKFYNTASVCIIKEFIRNLLKYYNFDYTLIFTPYSKENKLKLATYEESLTDTIMLLSSCQLDIKKKTYTNNLFNQISISKEVDQLINELQY